jgi:acetyltransferase-like isoleucine patch superfamily enzyme
MKIIKKIINKIKNIINPPKTPLLFFTKDFFKENKFIIGDYTYGKPTVLFENEEANLTIGKFCSIADNVTIFLGGNHRTDWITTYPFSILNACFPEASHIEGHPITKGNVVIGNDVWIGRNVIIMSGIIIGDGAVIAAGSVVSKNIGDYEIWGGNPIRLLKKRFNMETIVKLQKQKWWDWEISKIKDNIEFLCSTNIDKIK